MSTSSFAAYVITLADGEQERCSCLGTIMPLGAIRLTVSGIEADTMRRG